MASMATYGPYEAIDAIIMIPSGVYNVQIDPGDSAPSDLTGRYRAQPDLTGRYGLALMLLDD